MICVRIQIIDVHNTVEGIKAHRQTEAGQGLVNRDPVENREIDEYDNN